MKSRLLLAALCVGAMLGAAALAFADDAPRQGSRSNSKTVAELDRGTATARCKPGDSAISGGFRGEFDASEVVSGNSPQLQVIESRLKPERGWASSAFNVGGTGDLTTYVYCGPRGPSAASTSTTVDGTPFMGTTSTGGATARCPAGTKVISGGFDNPSFRVTGDYGTDTRLIPYLSRRSGPREWTVEAANFGGADGRLVAYAYCQDVPAPRAKRQRATFTAPMDEVVAGAVVARCARGQRVLSGGFKLTGPEPHLVASRRARRRGWKVTGAVGYPGQVTVTAYAYCENG